MQASAPPSLSAAFCLLEHNKRAVDKNDREETFRYVVPRNGISKIYKYRLAQVLPNLFFCLQIGIIACQIDNNIVKFCCNTLNGSLIENPIAMRFVLRCVLPIATISLIASSQNYQTGQMRQGTDVQIFTVFSGAIQNRKRSIRYDNQGYAYCRSFAS